MNKKKEVSFLLKNKEIWEKEDYCFVVNSEKLVENIANMKKALKGDIFYSFKTNPDAELAKIILKQDIGLLFSSVEELEKISKISEFDVNRTIFQSPSLTEEQIIKIKEIGVRRFVIDSQDQLDSILKNTKEIIGLELLIRINTGVKVDNPELSYGKDSFLGFPLDEAKIVLKRLNKIKEERKIVLGIHNHLLSQNISLELWRKNTQKMADFVDALKEDKIKIDTVDFGGGYPIEYNHEVPSVEDVGKIIFESQKRMLATFPELNFVFEPGRKTVGESITLLGRVIHIKNFLDSNVVILNCSLYNCSMDTLIVNLYLPVCKVSNESKFESEDYIIRGSTPDSLDIFSNGVILPKLEKGDTLAFLNAGAYSFGSEFISLSKSKHIII